jgi:23S rRNA (adenine2503-C2)-methyltransferase
MRKLIYDLTFDELSQLVGEWGEPAYRAKQIWQGLYKGMVGSADELTTLPKVLRRRLSEEFLFQPLEEAAVQVSSDRYTRKYLFSLPDGNTIETVLMFYEKRRSICISTQVGCAMGCPFCATGMGGLKRNLSAGEIVAQALYIARWLNLPEDGSSPVKRPTTLTHIVLMGMGEPMANYNNVWKALRIITDKQGFGLGARKITLSTVGLVPGIRKMAREPLQVNLAISLHAPTDRLRNKLVPINRKYPLSELMDAVREYIKLTNRRVTFEYALMRGVNDDLSQADLLADLLSGILAHVNLIPLNPVPGSPFQPSNPERANAFLECLRKRGISATMRLRRGTDIEAGCGQLRQRVLKEKP